ncbi:MAG: hypothetical protein ACSHW7_00575 [Patiriisocius sp.]|uniref:hypothetical protein n=1 Tax=Patiriisocius sp. TaxID=2822396 RepID=UPI003EF3BE36
MIETVMAMSIVTLCTLVGTLIYGSIIKTIPPVVRYNYQAETEKSLEKIILTSDINETKETFKSFEIQTKVINKRNGLEYIQIIVTSGQDTFVTPLFVKKEAI